MCGLTGVLSYGTIAFKKMDSALRGRSRWSWAPAARGSIIPPRWRRWHAIATGLTVDREVEPGVPTSILRGGGWDGQRIVPKSGGFGDSGLLVRLLGR